MCDWVSSGLRVLVGLDLQALFELDLVPNKVVKMISCISESKPLVLPWGRTPRLDSGVRVRKHVVRDIGQSGTLVGQGFVVIVTADADYLPGTSVDPQVACGNGVYISTSLVYLTLVLPIPPVSNRIADEEHEVSNAVVSKFNKPVIKSLMTASEVASVAKKYDIPLDLHPKDSPYRYDKERVVAQCHRHHDSDISDRLPGDDFNILDVRLLAKKIIDLQPIHLGLLYTAGLATTWENPCYRLLFRNTGGDVVHTTNPLPPGQLILAKTDAQKTVEVADRKVLVVKEKKKAQAV
ncbi:hypothetical protein Tco_0936965 [Tanacetum coccineum]|uniref:Uncharacterized protein n=1 Tax=Tanacetum coccineum TaxID=301880 RepID=A0ABQ5DCW0_9ASTR